MMLTNLAAVARRSGLRVIEIPGWQQRGRGPMSSVESIICHHTGTPASITGAYPTLVTVRDGRPGLAGPLAQLGLGRDCAVRVIAAGRANHAGVVFHDWQSNPHAIGIEAEHPGGGTPWPRDMYDAYVQLVAALRVGYAVPVARCQGHKEVAKPTGRKPDPTFNMTQFRIEVARTGTTPPQEDDDMQLTDTVMIEGKPLTVEGLLVMLFQRQKVIYDRTTDDDARFNRLQADVDQIKAALQQG